MKKEKDKDIRKQDIKEYDADIAKQQKEHEEQVCIDSLVRIYQSAAIMEKTKYGTLSKSVKEAVVRHLSDMVIIVEKDAWHEIHLHDAFPRIDIRMLVCECPVDRGCPYLLAVLRKIRMSEIDYTGYRKRAGMMIVTEHKRKLGKHR